MGTRRRSGGWRSWCEGVCREWGSILTQGRKGKPRRKELVCWGLRRFEFGVCGFVGFGFNAGSPRRGDAKNGGFGRGLRRFEFGVCGFLGFDSNARTQRAAEAQGACLLGTSSFCSGGLWLMWLLVFALRRRGAELVSCGLRRLLATSAKGARRRDRSGTFAAHAPPRRATAS